MSERSELIGGRATAREPDGDGVRGRSPREDMDGEHYVRFHELARTLRERCPWDREQDHRSLRRYLIEETHEVVDAIDALVPGDPATDAALIEELGDLLYQVELHATIAEQDGRFDMADVTSVVHDKLVARHPHVFGDVLAADADAVATNWDAIKRVEKQRTSVFDGVARSLPALAYGQQLARKAAKVGFDWPDVEGSIAKIEEEVREVREVTDGAQDKRHHEIGDLLFAVVNLARKQEFPPVPLLTEPTESSGSASRG